MRMLVAAIQYEPRFAAKEENILRLLDLVGQAAQAGAKLAVLPEMATTGYAFHNRREIAPMVESVPGGTTIHRFAAVAAKHQIYIVIGLAEVDPTTGAYYNTAALVGPGGYIGKYRKTHLYHADSRWAVDGDLGVPVFETPIGRIAMLICMDADYMEPARLAALAGADIIAFPTNWEGERTTWHARALENGVYFVAANRWGEERGTSFCGDSKIIDPRGEVLAAKDRGDGILLAEVDLAVSRVARSLAMAERRPQAYHDLLLSSHLWSQAEMHPLMPTGRLATVAVGQALSVARMADQARWADRQARDKGWPHLDLMVFPCGPVGAEGIRPLHEVAASLESYICWAGCDEQGAHGTWLVGPEGLVGRHQEIHSSSGQPQDVTGVTIYDLPWGRVALMTGSDLAVPEMARLAAMHGADLIAAPSDLAGPYDRLRWRARWLENDTPVAVANRGGGSQVLGAASSYAAEAGESGLVITTVDTQSEAVRCKELLRKRQPRWYLPLVQA